MDLLFEHIFSSEKCSNRSYDFYNAVRVIWFFYLAGLLWWPIDLLKWLPETSVVDRYGTEPSEGDRIKAESLEVTFHSARSENIGSFDKSISAAQQKGVTMMSLNRNWSSSLGFTSCYMCWIKEFVTKTWPVPDLDNCCAKESKKKVGDKKFVRDLCWDCGTNLES